MECGGIDAALSVRETTNRTKFPGRNDNHEEHEVHEEGEWIEVIDRGCCATGTTTSGCLDRGRELVRTFPRILREHRVLRGL